LSLGLASAAKLAAELANDHLRRRLCGSDLRTAGVRNML